MFASPSIIPFKVFHSQLSNLRYFTLIFITLFPITRCTGTCDQSHGILNTYDLTWDIELILFLFSAADSRTPYPTLPFHHSDSVKEKAKYLDLAHEQKVERKSLPRVRERRSQIKTQVCFSNIFLVAMLVIAHTALAESVGK